MGADADRELFEGMFREWERGEFWNADPWADDVVFIRSGPDGGEYHGHAGLAQAWRDFLGAWDDFRIAGEEVIPGEADTYVLFLVLHGRGKGSGLVMEQRVANVVQLREGLIVRSEMFWDRDAALRAAGADRRPG